MDIQKCSGPKIQKARLRIAPEGYTFIDLIMASTILLMLLLGIGHLILSSSLMKFRGDIKLASAEMASTKLEEIRATLKDKGGEEGEPGSESLSLPWIETAFDRKWRIVDTGEEMIRIEVECYLRSDPCRKVRMALYFSRRLGF